MRLTAKHQLNQLKFCLICWKAAPRDDSKKPQSKRVFRTVQKSQEDIIKNFYVKGYSFNDNRFPKVICSSCRLKILNRKPGNNTVEIAKYPHESVTSKQNRLNSNKCKCFLCTNPRVSVPAIPESNQSIEEPIENADYSEHSNDEILQQEPIHQEIHTTTITFDSSIFSVRCRTCLREGMDPSHRCTKDGFLDEVMTMAHENGCDEILAAKIIKKKSEETNDKDQIMLKNRRGKPTTLYLTKPRSLHAWNISDVIEIRNYVANSDRKIKFFLKKLHLKG